MKRRPRLLRRDQRGAASGERVEDEVARFRDRGDEISQQTNRLLGGVHHLGAVDLRECDEVFWAATGETVFALNREDNVLMRRCKRCLGVTHAW